MKLHSEDMSVSTVVFLVPFTGLELHATKNLLSVEQIEGMADSFLLPLKIAAFLLFKTSVKPLFFEKLEFYKISNNIFTYWVGELKLRRNNRIYP